MSPKHCDRIISRGARGNEIVSRSRNVCQVLVSSFWINKIRDGKL